jgi:hypothetical protein
MSSSNEVVFPPLVSKLEPPKTSLIARVGLDEPEDDEEERRIAQLNKKVFNFLCAQTETYTLDFRGQSLNDSVLWNATNVLRGECTAVNFSGMKNITAKRLRSIALTMGESLEAINLAGCPVDDYVMQTIMIRLFRVRFLNLSGCMLITNSALKTLSEGCKETLTALDISGCLSITEAGISWLAGTVGQMSLPCKKLVSLNLTGCNRIRNPGIQDLGYGCNGLQFLAVGGCTELTSVSIVALAKGCPHLRLINLYGCMKIRDRALGALGKFCPELESVNFGRCPLISDKGVIAVAEGCPKIQSVNLAADVLISEKAVCSIADNCKSLQMLNVTGCEDVTENGMKELLRGLPFTTMAQTYIGFKPREGYRHIRIDVQRKTLEKAAAEQIQALAIGHATRQRLVREREGRIMFFAARRIQINYRGRRARKKFAEMKHYLVMEAAAIKIQQWVRNRLDRFSDLVLEALKLLYEQQTAVVTRCQALYRGRQVRRKIHEVGRAIRQLREDREIEAAEAVVIRFQGLIRSHQAYRKMIAMAEEINQRVRDETLGALHIQRVIRGHLGRQRGKAARREVWRAEIMRSGDTSLLGLVGMQKIFRGRCARLKLAARGLREVWKIQLTYISSSDIQRIFRGYSARQLLKEMKLTRKLQTAASITVQRMYRGHRISSWKILKMDLVKNRVRGRLAKQQLVVQKRVAAALKLRQMSLDNDSASDEDATDDEWQEYTDPETGQLFYFSPALNQRKEVKPTNESWEHSLIGSRVQIYWPMEDEDFEGEITDFHLRKNKYRVQYDDGEHEWIDLRAEQDRVKIFYATEDLDGDGIIDDNDRVWLEFRFCRNPHQILEAASWLESQPSTMQLEDGSHLLEAGHSTYDLDDEWVEYIDETTLEPYYYNASTGETRYDLDFENGSGTQLY